MMAETTLKLDKVDGIVTKVQERIEELSQTGGINFPPNYSVANALRSAWLIIQDTKDKTGRAALDVCTRESVFNALFNTAVQGLSPAKKQIYYVVYGDQLQAQRSYFGTMAVTKRIPGVVDIISDVVYPGDTFKASKSGGSWQIEEHVSDWKNIDPDNLEAAYCTIVFEGGGSYTEIMNRKQIENSWNKSRSRDRTVHKEFPDQMAKRTVINRACKVFMNSSDDSDLLIEAFNSTGDRIVDNQAPDTRKDQRIEALNQELSGAIETPPLEEKAMTEEGEKHEE